MPNPFSLCVFPAFCLRAALCRLHHEPAGEKPQHVVPQGWRAAREMFYISQWFVYLFVKCANHSLSDMNRLALCLWPQHFICLRRDKSDCLGWVKAEFVEFPHKGTDEYTFILVQSACKNPNQIEFLLYQIRQSIMYSSSNQYYLLGHRYFWSPKLR